jgi:hypothetical protein
MTKDEALNLALAALEYFIDTSTSLMDYAMAEDACTAIKQARSATVQEPVATIDSLEQEIYENTREFVSLNVMEWLLNRLNTTPPAAQRQWVGLTNKELADCWDTIPERAMKRVEDKLKEKNT